MQLWKIVWRDGKTSYLQAESRHQIVTEIFPEECKDIQRIVSAVRHPCDDRTNPWARSGLPGHRGENSLARA